MIGLDFKSAVNGRTKEGSPSQKCHLGLPTYNTLFAGVHPVSFLEVRQSLLISYPVTAVPVLTTHHTDCKFLIVSGAAQFSSSGMEGRTSIRIIQVAPHTISLSQHIEKMQSYSLQ